MPTIEELRQLLNDRAQAPPALDTVLARIDQVERSRNHRRLVLSAGVAAIVIVVLAVGMALTSASLRSGRDTHRAANSSATHPPFRVEPLTQELPGSVTIAPPLATDHPKISAEQAFATPHLGLPISTTGATPIVQLGRYTPLTEPTQPVAPILVWLITVPAAPASPLYGGPLGATRARQTLPPTDWHELVDATTGRALVGFDR